MYPLFIVFGNEVLTLRGRGILHGLEERPAVLSAASFYTKFGTNALFASANDFTLCPFNPISTLI